MVVLWRGKTCQLFEINLWKLSGLGKKYPERMQIAIVTGAAQGIGRRTAEVLAGAGFGLLLMDMQACTGTVVAVEVAGADGGEGPGDISGLAVCGWAGGEGRGMRGSGGLCVDKT